MKERFLFLNRRQSEKSSGNKFFSPTTGYGIMKHWYLGKKAYSLQIRVLPAEGLREAKMLTEIRLARMK